MHWGSFQDWLEAAVRVIGWFVRGFFSGHLRLFGVKGDFSVIRRSFKGVLC